MTRQIRRMRRSLVLVLMGALLTVTTSLGLGVRPAYAFDLCKDAPTPVGPKSGMAGLLTMRPAEIPTADPFTDPRVPIADVYGYSWQWSVFDLGCTPDALSDPQAVFNTANGNLILGFASTGMAALGLVERFAKDSGIGWFTTWVAQVATAVQPMILGGPSQNGVLVGLLPMACLALGVLLVWRARRAAYQATTQAVLMLIICLGLATWTLLFPAVASSSVDAGIRQVATVSEGAFNASLSDGANRQALYRSWLAGQFGDPDSHLAQTYGPRVLAATHYTWAEWDQIQANPDTRKAIDGRKATEYKQIADEVKDINPSAYLTFQGRGDRIGTAIFGLLVGFIMGIFALTAYFMILLGRAMMQVLVVIVPVGAVIGVLPPGYGVVMRLWDLFTAAVWAVAKFTFGAGLMATILGLLATLDPISAVLWMTVVTVIAFFVLRPGREFKRLIPGLDPDRNYLRDGIEKLAGAAFTLAGAAATGGASAAAAGAAAAAAHDNDTADQPSGSTGAASAPGSPGTQRAGREWVGDLTTPATRPMERPGLPAPQWVQIPGTHQHLALDPAPDTQQAEAPGPRQWDGVLDTPSTVRLALPPGPTTHAPDDAPRRVTTTSTDTTGDSTRRAAGDPTPGPGSPVASSSPPSPASSSVAGSAGGVPAPAPPAVVREVITVTQLTDQPVEAGGAVLHGDLVRETDHSVYRRPETPAPPGASRHVVEADVVEAEVVALVDLSAQRDRGSDQPSTELVLYRSGRN